MEYTILTIDGNSMQPLYKPNMKVLIKKNAKSYNVGDVVIYYQNNKAVIHRVIQIYRNKVAITKGDNNVYADKIVRVSNIIGKVLDKQDKKDKQLIALYSRFVAIVAERYGNTHAISCFIFRIFILYLQVKFE